MKIGLCLAGGGIKGAAHIGAIKALEEDHIRFDCVAGTSAGSIVATLYAMGYSADEMYKLFERYAKDIRYIDWKNIFRIVYGVLVKRKLIVKGLNSGEVIEKIVSKACNSKGIFDIDQMQNELLIPAVDAESGKVFVFNSLGIDAEDNNEKYISKMDIGKAVRASCSYPLMFSPCPYKDTNLLDGGIKENIPWRELNAIGCKKVLSISFFTKNKKKCCQNVIEISERTFELMCEELNRHEIEKIDFLHKIELNNVSLLEIEKLKEIYEEGYKQTKSKIRIIKNYLYNSYHL